MTRDELIELGEKIISARYSDEETSRFIELFNRNVPHPSGANLFFWPEDHDFRKNDISEYSPRIEEVIDLCLSYKPIQL